MVKSIIDKVIKEQVEWVSRNPIIYPLCMAKGFQGRIRLWERMGLLKNWDKD